MEITPLEVFFTNKPNDRRAERMDLNEKGMGLLFLFCLPIIRAWKINIHKNTSSFIFHHQGLLGMVSFFEYSNKSPGWQSRALQMDSRVLNRMAFALPVFKIERLASVKSTLEESSFNDILRFAIITSKFTMIGIAYTVKSFSF
jgi:hypothetical protein